MKWLFLFYCLFTFSSPIQTINASGEPMAYYNAHFGALLNQDVCFIYRLNIIPQILGYLEHESDL